MSTEGVIVTGRINRDGGVGNIGAVVTKVQVKAGVHVNSQLTMNLMKGSGGQRSRRRKYWYAWRKECSQLSELAVCWAKITSPLRHAVGLVDDNGANVREVG